MLEAIHRSARVRSDESDHHEPSPVAPKSLSSRDAAARQERHIEQSGRHLAYPPELFRRPAPSTDYVWTGRADRPARPPAAPTTDGASSAAATTRAGKIHTSSPNEVAATNTRPVPRELVAAIRQRWPELTEAGAIALAAQSSAETGHWEKCWNWNFGNVKASEAQPHMYLRGTWEGVARRTVVGADGEKRLETDDEVLARVRAANPALAHLVEADPSADHARAVGSRKASIVFKPPHPASRFVARPSMDDGLDFWVAKMKRFAAKAPGFVAALNTGDAKTIAHVLRENGYYSADEKAYAAMLAVHQKIVKKDLEKP